MTQTGSHDPGPMTESRIARLIEMTSHAAPHPGSRLPQKQRVAADLLAQVLHEPHVDAILGLNPGTVEGWLTNDQLFADAAARAFQFHERGKEPDLDFSRALEPDQVRAAPLLAEGLGQEEIAKEVGVSARTIRNWRKDPVFRLYVHDLAERDAAERGGAARAERLEMAERVRRLQLKALRLIEASIEAGDQKAILQVAATATRMYGKEK